MPKHSEGLLDQRPDAEGFFIENFLKLESSIVGFSRKKNLFYRVEVRRGHQVEDHVDFPAFESGKESLLAVDVGVVHEDDIILPILPYLLKYLAEQFSIYKVTGEYQSLQTEVLRDGGNCVIFCSGKCLPFSSIGCRL